MAKKKNHFHISNKLLGILIFLALIIQYVFPKGGINFLNPIAILIYLLVGIYLFLSSKI